MIHYAGFAQVVEADQNYEKPRTNAYGGSNKQIVGNGGSQQRNIVQTTRTQHQDCYPHMVGIVTVEPAPRSNQAQVREWTNRIKNENKQTGSYERVTMKEKMTRGETRVEKSTGRYGTADEYKRSSTIKIGDKNGYAEYHTEERVRRVNYDGNKSGSSSNRLIEGHRNASISVKHGSGSGMKNTTINVNHGKNKSTNVSMSYGNKKSTNSSGGKRMAK